MNSKRPDIYGYHNYQAFLKDWLSFLKESQSGFSLRMLAKQAGLASGYLSMVLSGKRPLSGAGLAKILPFLGLNTSEKSFLEHLLVLGTSDSHEARVSALDRMKRFHQYQKLNPQDTSVYEYLTHWYYVAIREMAGLPGFQSNPEWIQARLRFPVPLHEIKWALEFLYKNGYLELKDGQVVSPPEKALECSGGVYRVGLAKFHREILGLAAQSIDKVPSDRRTLQGHTVALSEKNFHKAKEMIDDLIGKLRELGETEKAGDSVYHAEVMLFPLTAGDDKEKEK